MAKSFLDFSGLNVFASYVKGFVNKKNDEVSDALGAERARAMAVEDSLFSTFSAVTSGDAELQGTSAASVLLTPETAHKVNALNVETALAELSADSSLTQYHHAADAKTTGDKIRTLEGQLDGYTFLTMTEEEYDNIEIKDVHTIYLLVDEDEVVDATA